MKRWFYLQKKWEFCTFTQFLNLKNEFLPFENLFSSTRAQKKLCHDYFNREYFSIFLNCYIPKLIFFPFEHFSFCNMFLKQKLAYSVLCCITLKLLFGLVFFWRSQFINMNKFFWFCILFLVEL